MLKQFDKKSIQENIQLFFWYLKHIGKCLAHEKHDTREEKKLCLIRKKMFRLFYDAC